MTLFCVFAAAHLQRAPTTGGNIVAQGGVSSWIQPQSLQLCHKVRLQSLQMERERLKLRQQEIMRQVVSHTPSLLMAQFYAYKKHSFLISQSVFSVCFLLNSKCKFLNAVRNRDTFNIFNHCGSLSM